MKFLNSNSYKKRQGGFTLMELLVVVAIIAILLAVIMISVSNSRQKGRDAKRIGDVRALSNALELYRSANNSYPSTLTPLTPNYISALPKDPRTNLDYFYTGLETISITPVVICNGYHLGTSMETNNSVMSSDADFSSQGGTVANRCQNPGTSAFGGTTYGASANDGAKCKTTGGGAAADTGSFCYDVINKQ